MSFAIQVAALAGALAVASSAAGAVASTLDDAKKEGVVVWYATMSTKDLEATSNEFMRTHPGIKVEPLRLGSSQLPARVVTEQRGGKYNADVISGDDAQIAQLLGVGAFDKYPQPQASSFAKGTVDPNGFWTNLYANTTVIAWNPQRLAADHLKPPTTVADFAKPEWKGKFGFDTGALNWYAGMLQTDKNAADLVKKIADNQPVKTVGHTQTLEQMEAGEFDASPTMYGYSVQNEKQSGKTNIDFMNPNPLFVSLNPIGVAKNAPHPNAARVLIDWLTSKEGQTYISSRGFGQISSRIDVKNNPAIWDGKRPSIIVDPPTGSQYKEMETQFRTLFGLPG